MLISCFATRLGPYFPANVSKRSTGGGSESVLARKTSAVNSAGIPGNGAWRLKPAYSGNTASKRMTSRKAGEERKKCALHFFQGAFFTDAICNQVFGKNLEPERKRKRPGKKVK